MHSISDYRKFKKRAKKKKKKIETRLKVLTERVRQTEIDNLVAEEKENIQLTCGYCNNVLGDDDVINKRQDDPYKYVYDCRFCGEVVVRYTKKWWLLTEKGKEDIIERSKHTQKFD